jgi:hypothetical protein
MKKIDFSKFDGSIEIVPKKPVKIIDEKQNDYFTTGSRSFGDPIIKGMNPVAAIESIVSGALSTISNIAQCITMVSVEKQRTKQIEAQARVQIGESIQQTERIRVQERETTRRFEIQCKASLRKMKQELEILRETNRSRERELSNNHEIDLKILDSLDRIVKTLVEENNGICQLILDMNGNDKDFEKILHLSGNSNNSLIEISKKIVEVRGDR